MVNFTAPRAPDWDERLHAYLVGKEGAAFVWGETDCALFVADAVVAMTGEDPAKAYRGRYATAGGSARALKRYGAGTLEATLDATFAARHPAFARRGDIVFAPSIDGRGMAGLCIGGDALFVGETVSGADVQPGLVRISRTAWLKAWSV